MPVSVFAKKNGQKGELLYSFKDGTPEENKEAAENVEAILGKENTLIEYESNGSDYEGKTNKDRKRGLSRGDKEGNTLNPEMAGDTASTPNEMTELLSSNAPEVMATGPAVPVREFSIPKRA